MLYLQELANQKEFLSSIKPMPRPTGGLPIVTAMTGEQERNLDNRKELFGASGGNSAATASGTDARLKQQKSSSALGGTMATMSETHEKLQERGEKLSRLSDRTEEMSNQANEFAKMAKQLNDQQKSRWF